MSYKQVVVVGVGGIGGYLISPLITYLKNHEDMPKDVVLVDGDIVERKNLQRQFFSEQDIGKKKSEAWVGRLGPVEDMTIHARADWLTKSNAEIVVPDETIVFSCVDNHRTRRLIHDISVRRHNILVISGGNEYSDGNVQIYERREGKDLLPTIVKYHEEIEYPQDDSPADMSCEELSESAPQLIFTNFEAAAQMLGAFWRRVEKGADHCEVNFDLLTGNVLPATRP